MLAVVGHLVILVLMSPCGGEPLHVTNGVRVTVELHELVQQGSLSSCIHFLNYLFRLIQLSASFYFYSSEAESFLTSCLNLEIRHTGMPNKLTTRRFAI